MTLDEAKEIINNRHEYQCNGGDIRFCDRCISTCKGDDPKLLEAEVLLRQTSDIDVRT